MVARKSVRTHSPVGVSRRFLRWLIPAVAILTAAALALRWGLVLPQTLIGDCRLSANAVWASVVWASQQHAAAAAEDFASATGAQRMRYVFPYTTYLKAEGTFNPTYSFAAEFVTEFKRANPNARVLAWIGLPLRSRDKLGVQGYVNLSDAATRAKVAALAAELVSSAGFDGIHLDAETVRRSDRVFLRLLDEVRAAVGPNTRLSVAGAHCTPDSFAALPIIRDLRWSTSY